MKEQHYESTWDCLNLNQDIPTYLCLVNENNNPITVNDELLYGLLTRDEGLAKLLEQVLNQIVQTQVEEQLGERLGDILNDLLQSFY
ncbi:hypothetical protein PcaKH35_34930 [Parageobacillus caldoxylosilyticus]|nr:hypothetical protein PcaKH35_34930 [Parageobacillus caldoxylosilyticus]